MQAKQRLNVASPRAFALLLALFLAATLALGAATSAIGAEGDDQHREMIERVQRNGVEGKQEMGEGIPPVLIDGTQKLDPHQLEPIDPAAIELTLITPADRFIRATTPLLVALSLGAFALLGLAISQAVRKRSAGEIRLGE